LAGGFFGERGVGEIGGEGRPEAAISATMQATAKERKDFLDVVIRVPPF